MTHHPPDTPQYRAARLRHALAEDPRTAELGVRVTVRGDSVLLTGDVACDSRRTEIERLVHELAPDAAVLNDIRVTTADVPHGREELR